MIILISTSEILMYILALLQLVVSAPIPDGAVCTLYTYSTELVGDGNAQVRHFYQQLSENLNCSNAEDCFVGETDASAFTFGFSFMFGGNNIPGLTWIQGSWDVSQTWTTSQTYDCTAAPDQTVCIWYKSTQMSYLVQSVRHYSCDAGDEASDPTVLNSPINGNPGGGYYCVIGTCRSKEMVDNDSDGLRRLNRSDYEDLLDYLQAATASQMSNVAWGPRIVPCHGERRAISQRTFHIGIWRESSTGHHFSGILLGGNHGSLVEGSIIDHGTTQPSLVHVLNEHKRQYRVSPTTSSSSSSDSESDHGAGGSGGRGGGQRRRNGRTVKGNDLPSQWEASYNRRGNTYSSAHNQGYASTSSYANAAPYYLAGSSNYSTSSSYYTTPSSSTSSQTRYYQDRATGRNYYIDSQGRTRWV
ncbi:uncharacterized protein F4822DRAFT_427471 [Hypoxylon trugodes]|uniref:uncharacterized protein n=1 Tax=Hypoxylon trugodes TaxID=326681 RepID=UPI0021905319|nr:uncharacterized protein F4822DRAFT_427471 [Hypoxylon trugodes]KAI1391616.1 hypothetical protein F4822DRAFT_427471 [Hypoxylon trugodes]